ncbi:MAG: hypothetical protein JNL98_18855 [Bryobacterales bacterium]|nr:hypothetical protein [Bryobacterales bacterium]
MEDVKRLEVDFWPASLRHLSKPYSNSADGHVLVARVSSEPSGAYPGFECLHTALVPLPEVGAILNTPGGIGQEVRCWGPRPTHLGQARRNDFWVDGAIVGQQYEALVHTWRVQDREVLVPDNAFLMCYGLVPRTCNDGSIHWDDPRGPTYDVVIVHPVYMPKTTASISVLRRYLEDYLSLKECAALGVYYEERYSAGDTAFDEAVGPTGWRNAELPGRRFWLRRVHIPPQHEDQLSQVAGCRLILPPGVKPVTEEERPTLDWPDYGVLSDEQIRHLRPMDYVYIRDEFLKRFEGKDDYEIHPSSGSVSHGNWWGLSYCRRFGRNHIEAELLKLYEGTPKAIIEEVHCYAVSKEVAARDVELHGGRHIGARAEDFVMALLNLTEALTQVANKLGVHVSQRELGGYDSAEVSRNGWWTTSELKPLGNVSFLSMSREDFLGRCTALFKPFEGLKERHLRETVDTIGIPREKTKDFRSLKLLEVICQVAEISIDTGLDLTGNRADVASRWDAASRVEALKALFALNGLRQLDAHRGGRDFELKLRDSLSTFEIDPASTVARWGKALDTVYDKLQESLEAISCLLRRA